MQSRLLHNICAFQLILVCHLVSGQHDPLFHPNRSTIVQLFEWTFDAVAQECEQFLGPNGFGGVIVSPVTENLVVPSRPWYERYQPMSYVIASRSGTESQLLDTAERCNRAGVRIYVDVVLNHMAGQADVMIGTAGSTAVFENRSYPSVPYVNSDFHRPCKIIHFKDAHMVRNCDLYALPDLDQALESVRQRIAELLNRLLDLGVAGFRIGSSKHMWPNDLKAVYSEVNNVSVEHGFPENTRPFICQEVLDNNEEPISKSEYTFVGTVFELEYADLVGKAFLGIKPLSSLANIGPRFGFVHSSDAIVFLDNHDLQRSPQNESTTISFRKPLLLQTANAFMLAHRFGIPVIMSSYDFVDSGQGPPVRTGTEEICSPFAEDCPGWMLEHRSPSIVEMVKFRNAVGRSPVRSWQNVAEDQIAFCRGERGFFATNMNAMLDLDEELFVCVSEGEYCDVMSIDEKGKCLHWITVSEKRLARIRITKNQVIPVVAIYKIK